jgi:uncharacterized OsmC-like protein
MNKSIALSASLKQGLTVENHSVTNVWYADESKELEEEQVKRLLDVSNRCPVAKIISNPIEFKFA